MDSTQTSLDPDEAVDLRTTLAEGPPVPFSVLSEIRTREEDQEVVFETAQLGNVRLRTSDSGSSVGNNDADETSVIMPVPNDPVPSKYPGLNLNPRYELFKLTNTNSYIA